MHTWEPTVKQAQEDSTMERDSKKILQREGEEITD
jgi:hypothetical protein